MTNSPQRSPIASTARSNWPALFPTLVAALLLTTLPLPSPVLAEPVATNPSASYKSGNWAEAYDGYRKQLLDSEASSKLFGRKLQRAIDCLNKLGRVEEFDALIESVIKAHDDDWRLLMAASEAYRDVEHDGRMVDGEFQRGSGRGRARIVSAWDRDHVRALQLGVQAISLIDGASNREVNRRTAARDLIDLTTTLQHYHRRQAWRLATLTNLDDLPDYDEGRTSFGSSTGAPVTEEGDPVLHAEPASWEAAQSDGERWRWLLAEAVRWNPETRFAALQRRADFSREQFGVQTLGGSFHWPWASDPDEAQQKSGILTLHTLADDETVARLATGIKRFKLPAEHHYLALLAELFEEKRQAEQAFAAAETAATLAEAYLDRRQFPRAADYFREAIKLTDNDNRRAQYRKRLDQITGAWGEFEAAGTQPAGAGASVEFRFRNAEGVDLTAQPIDVKRLLTDVKAYLKSNPERLDWRRFNVGGIGYQILDKDHKKYVGAVTANWQAKLDPAADHFDKRVTLTTPLQTPGAYLVTAKVKQGNTSHIVLWVADTAIVKKPLAGKMLYYVADAESGQPVPRATLELFGFHQHHNRDKPNTYHVETSNFAVKSDARGLTTIAVAPEQLKDDYQWLATATTAEGRLAFLGFSHVWSAQLNREFYNRASAYVMTDRPVYRPEQTVKWKASIGRSLYGDETKPATEAASEFAHQAFRVKLYDPKGDEILSQTLTANAYGGVEAEHTLPPAAPLGQYRIVVEGQGEGSFRVEEYKKPEFEVTVDAPTEAVALGDSFAATVTAKYYFGSPVASGTIKYKVTRTERDVRWYPPTPWDWLYGPGYWWFGHDTPWYPGWRRWGCLAPLPPWWNGGWQQPEVIAEGAAALDADGEYEIKIDTAIAKQLYGDSDHSYQIEAQVIDASRRTIVGAGEVIVARKPFEVFVWPDRGHYRLGDIVTASVAARRPDGKPVTGAGKLRLFKINYAGEPATGELAEPKETEVRSWDLATGAAGRATLQIKASEPGQYRLAYELPVQKKTSDEQPAGENGAGQVSKIEGAHLFTVAGETVDGSQFVFNDLQLTPDLRTYKPGEKVKLRIDTNRTGGTVLLFARPANGVYSAPQIVSLAGKSRVVELDVTASDAPNFFVEALTVAGGETHSAVREIAVPPEKRILNVEVLASAEAYLPGQEASVKVRLTDQSGEPFVGETVVTVYDKSVEYIAGGSNVGDIREHFWKWRRHHHPNTETSLDRSGGNLVAPGDPRMQRLGRFGHVLPARGMRGRGALGLEMVQSRVGDMALPAAAAPMEMSEDAAVDSFFADEGRMAKSQANGGPEMVQPTVRENFADTAFWTGALETDQSGLAEIKFTMPENLTAWKIRVWGMGHGTRVGEGAAEVVTRKNLLVRLQTPRFLVERDEVVLSANVHNYLDSAKQVRVRLELAGETLEAPAQLEQTIEVPPGGDRRVDWRLSALREGSAVVRAFALTDEESDAMQLEFPVLVHGVEKMEAFSGVIARDGRLGTFEFTIPEKRRPRQTRLEVRYSPTLAGSMVDALPYLIDYPHGCTEQTLNRFLPAVLTQQTLLQMGVDLSELSKQAGDLDPGQLPGGKPAWERMQENPVFDKAKLDQIVAVGVKRLQDMQLTDGGWGWFSGYGERSSAHTTATVVRGLLVAQENDVAIVPGVIDQGVEWLTGYQSQQLARLNNMDAAGKVIDKDKPAKRYADNLDALVHLVLTKAGKPSDQMRDRLFRDRTKLAPYALAMLGVALHEAGDQQENRDAVIRNLEQFLVTDEENQTAYLKLPGDSWWYWYGSEYEAQAYFLKLLAATKPESDAAAGLVKYLLANRRHATYWNSTRDTALVIEAMADYLQASGEGRPELTVEVWLDGERRKEVAINADNLMTFDNKFVALGIDLEAGRHTLELRKKGGGRVYWNAFLTNFTLEDDIRAAGLEIRVQRKLYKLTPVDKKQLAAGARGQAIEQRGEKYQRTEITNLASVTSGDLVEVELTLHSKNDYEYLILSDRKAAGFEPVEVRSGYNGNELGAYVEYRDAVVNLFLRQLGRGSRSVSYRLRAEAPGKFSALPAEITAMYAPELRGNSDEIKVRVRDTPQD